MASSTITAGSIPAAAISEAATGKEADVEIVAISIVATAALSTTAVLSISTPSSAITAILLLKWDPWAAFYKQVKGRAQLENKVKKTRLCTTLL